MYETDGDGLEEGGVGACRDLTCTHEIDLFGTKRSAAVALYLVVIRWNK